MARHNRYNNRRNNYSNNRGFDRQPKKRSGAKQGVITKGKNRDEGFIYLSAWKANKRHGLVTVKGFENQKSTRSEARSTGNKFVTIMLEIVFRDSGNKMLELVNYNLTTGKVYIDQLGWVLSTKAPNGGFLGKVK